jgi:cell wall-associated NlpC family hydrolase
MTDSCQTVRRGTAALVVAVVATLASACATTRVVRPPLPPAAGTVALDRFGIATTALALQGVPYRLGGSSLSGFDCSGLVQYVFTKHGRPMSRVVKDQFEEGREVDADDLRPGDLVFFRTDGRRVSHVGIAIGGDRFVHAPNSRGVVRVESLGSDYWSQHYVGARRIE